MYGMYVCGLIVTIMTGKGHRKAPESPPHMYLPTHIQQVKKGLQVAQFAWKSCREFQAIPVLRAPTEDMSPTTDLKASSLFFVL